MTIDISTQDYYVAKHGGVMYYELPPLDEGRPFDGQWLFPAMTTYPIVARLYDQFTGFGFSGQTPFVSVSKSQEEGGGKKDIMWWTYDGPVVKAETFWVPAQSGTPTDTPSTYSGSVPFRIDPTSKKLWAYVSGGWKSAALA